MPMNCPICPNAELAMSERHGVEIDYCPKCRGVWLDRGELDKIIERASESAVGTGTSHSLPQYDAPARVEPVHHQSDSKHDSGFDQYGRKRKKENFLADIFDF